MAIQDEVVSGPPVGNIISGDDIDSLAISVEELKKVLGHLLVQSALASMFVLLLIARLLSAIVACY